MPIRAAKYRDLLPASHICAAAFNDDPLFGELIHPFRQEYPGDVHLYWLKRFRAEFQHEHNYFMVATSEDEGGIERVTGIAHWIRKGADADEIGADIQAKEEVEETFPPNRAADSKNEDIIERTYPHLLWQWSGPRAESWYLACLAIDPKCQGQGVGRSLVEWGFEQAAKENVCVSVISAYGKDGFYRRCGFDKESGTAGDGEGNPLAGIEGGLVLFHDV